MQSNIYAGFSPAQRISTRFVDFLLDKFYFFKTQEAYSVVRTLHALCGIQMAETLEVFVKSTAFLELPSLAQRELLSLIYPAVDQ